MRAEIEQRGEEREEQCEVIRQACHPRERLDAQRMHSPEECAERRAHLQPRRTLHFAFRIPHSAFQEPAQQEKEQHCIRAVQQDIREMIAERVQSEHFMHQRPCEPRERLVADGLLEVREHPAEVLRRQPLDARVLEDVDVVVPAQEARLQCAEEDGEDHRDEREHDGGGSVVRAHGSVRAGEEQD